MFTIYHGDNVLVSRRALESAKKMARDKEVVVLDGKKATLTDLKQALEARSLFGQEKLVIVENLIVSKRQRKKPIELASRQAKKESQILEYLKKLPSDVDLVLWEGKKIDGRVLSRFKNARVQLFKTPAIIFKFLESLRPGNTKIVLSLLGSCIKAEPIEFVFYMIVRQFRQLLLVKDLGKKGVPRLAPWQYSRLTNQANCFILKGLKKIYRELLKIDLEQKTGKAPLNLKRSIELLLVDL